MQNRHKKLIGIFTMFLLIVLGLGLYAFVGFYYKHVWSLIFIIVFELLGFLTPATCYGYNFEDTVYLQGNLDESSYRNYRDMGYVLAGMFYLLTYIFPTASWAGTEGVNPPYLGVVFVYLGNTSIILAYACWIKIFL